MTVLSVGFTKIAAEHQGKGEAGQIKINTNVGITSVEKMDLKLSASATPSVRFSFEFKVSYEPSVGSILINGHVIYLESKEAVQTIVDGWKKNKKVDDKIMVEVINKILNRAHVEALILSKELSLPAPIQLPKVSKKN